MSSLIGMSDIYLSPPGLYVWHRLFYSWDSQRQGTLALQDVVLGLDSIMSGGLMESIEWFFNLVSPPPPAAA